MVAELIEFGLVFRLFQALKPIYYELLVKFEEQADLVHNLLVHLDLQQLFF